MMSNISAFVEMDNKQATLELTHLLDEIEIPENVYLTINNIHDGESGVMRTDDSNEKSIDISLAHCFTMEDVVRELIKLVAEQK